MLVGQIVRCMTGEFAGYKREKRKSYHDGELEEGDIDEEIALSGKAWRVLFQIASIRP